MKEFPGAYPCTAEDCLAPDAIAAMIKAGDFDHVVKEILRVTVLLNQGKIVVSIADLDSWIRALPKELANSPEITFTTAWIMSGQGLFSKAVMLMEEVFSQWHDRWQHDRSDTVRQWLFYIKGAQGILYDHIGAITKAHSCFSVAAAFLPPTPQVVRHLALDLSPEEESRLATDDPSGLSTLLIHALRVFQMTESKSDIARTAHNLGCQYLERGEADRAKYWLERAAELRYTQGGQLPMLFSLHSLGQCYHQLGLLEEANNKLDECLSLSTQFGSILHQACSLSSLANVRRDGGHYTSALLLYDKSLEINHLIHNDAGLLDTLLGKATLYAMKGEFALSLNCVIEAQSHSHGSRKLRLLTDMYYEITLLRLNRSTNHTVLESIVQKLTKLGYKRDILVGTWYIAYAQLLANEHVKARETLVLAMQLSMQCSQIYALSHELCYCMPLTKLAFDEGLCPEALAGLVSHSTDGTLSQLLGHVPSARAVIAATGRLHRASIIFIELLGEFRVSRGGNVVDMSATRSQKAVLLLKYLAANKGHLMAREQIIEAVWPDSTFFSAEHSFEVAISTLRKLLDFPAGPSIIVRKGRGYQLHPEMLIRTDVELFAHSVKQGYWWLQRGQKELARLAWEEADALYKGDFLQEDIYVDWALMQRERLKEKYLDAVLALGEIAFERSELNEAIDRANLAISHDPLRESGYRLLMKAHFCQGNRAMALRDYLRCQQALMLELGEEPMPETRALLESIRSNVLK